MNASIEIDLNGKGTMWFQRVDVALSIEAHTVTPAFHVSTESAKPDCSTSSVAAGTSVWECWRK